MGSAFAATLCFDIRHCPTGSARWRDPATRAACSPPISRPCADITPGACRLGMSSTRSLTHPPPAAFATRPGCGSWGLATSPPRSTPREPPILPQCCSSMITGWSRTALRPMQSGWPCSRCCAGCWMRTRLCRALGCRPISLPETASTALPASLDRLARLGFVWLSASWMCRTSVCLQTRAGARCGGRYDVRSLPPRGALAARVRSRTPNCQRAISSKWRRDAHVGAHGNQP